MIFQHESQQLFDVFVQHNLHKVVDDYSNLLTNDDDDDDDADKLVELMLMHQNDYSFDQHLMLNIVVLVVLVVVFYPIMDWDMHNILLDKFSLTLNYILVL